ncbi:MAG: hypothetical protein JXA77_04455 [Bacteroidales bacterium]|nr:hypothetical protein [Bacteroidales bacterium]MBN2819806.1 hypothetical protein [Bacteroidales bacterium]
MKTNNLILQLVFLSIVFLISKINILAQEQKLGESLSFKVGYSKYQNTEFCFANYLKDYFDKNYNKVGNIRLSADFELNKYTDAGLYFGYCLYETQKKLLEDSTNRSWSFEAANSIMYGLNSNLHILPFFIKKESYRLDVYCSFQMGVVHLLESDECINDKHTYLEYGIYGGLAFYPFDHLGLYAEYGYAKYSNLRYGLGLRF